MSVFQPPPTYADVVITDSVSSGRPVFNPVWLKWFLDLASFFAEGGGINLSGVVGNATRIPFGDADGFLTDSANLTFDGTDLNLGASNKLVIGSDVNLYRVAADVLKTDDSLVLTKLGIGVDSPDYLLQIKNPAATLTTIAVEQTGTVRWRIGLQASSNILKFDANADSLASASFAIDPEGARAGLLARQLTLASFTASSNLSTASDDNNKYNVEVYDTQTSAAGAGGGIVFGGRRADGDTLGVFAGVRALFEAAGGASFSGSLIFTTRSGIGTLTERMRLTSGGLLSLGGAPTAGEGIFQLPTHTTKAGGIFFGSDVNLYRSGTRQMQLIGSLDLNLDGLASSAFLGVNVDAASDCGIDLKKDAGIAWRLYATPGAANAAGLKFFHNGLDLFFLTSEGQLRTAVSTTLTNTVASSQLLYHTTTGIPAAGIGMGIEFLQLTSSGNNESIGFLEVITTDVSVGSEDADFVIRLMAGGAAASEKFRVFSTGTIKFGTHSAIGVETVTGYMEVQDSAGNTRKLAVVS